MTHKSYKINSDYWASKFNILKKNLSIDIARIILYEEFNNFKHIKVNITLDRKNINERLVRILEGNRKMGIFDINFNQLTILYGIHNINNFGVLHKIIIKSRKMNYLKNLVENEFRNIILSFVDDKNLLKKRRGILSKLDDNNLNILNRDNDDFIEEPLYYLDLYSDELEFPELIREFDYYQSYYTQYVLWD